MLINDHHAVGLYNFKCLKSYVFMLLMACATLFCANTVGADHADSSPGELPHWKVLENEVLYESAESITSEDSTVSTQTGDTEFQNGTSDGLSSKPEELVPETGSSEPEEQQHELNDIGAVFEASCKLWHELQEDKLLILILAVVFSVLVACYVAPAISGFKAQPVIASGFAIFATVILIFIATTINCNLGWSFWLAMIVLIILTLGRFSNLLTNLVERVKSFVKVFLAVGILTVLSGLLILEFSFRDNPYLQIQLLVTTTIVISLTVGIFLTYSHEVKQLADSLFHRIRTSKIEEAGMSQRQSDDESATQAGVSDNAE
ncbi:MAG: hypothetical protein OXO50_09150 [Caldilineaceae bacterium]|nr:hypothetical protein [Caldilineaceae bacterium]